MSAESKDHLYSVCNYLILNVWIDDDDDDDEGWSYVQRKPGWSWEKDGVVHNVVIEHLLKHILLVSDVLSDITQGTVSPHQTEQTESCQDAMFVVFSGFQNDNQQ